MNRHHQDRESFSNFMVSILSSFQAKNLLALFKLSSIFISRFSKFTCHHVKVESNLNEALRATVLMLLFTITDLEWVINNCKGYLLKSIVWLTSGMKKSTNGRVVDFCFHLPQKGLVKMLTGSAGGSVAKIYQNCYTKYVC